MTNSGTERQSWDETWVMVAQVIAQRSLCVRDKVGAVIVDKTNRIVATGYNGPPTGFVHNNAPCIEWCQRAHTNHRQMLDTNYVDCPSNHAEANALSVCDRSARVGGTIYVTSHSCMGCAKLIANSGLSTLYVCSYDDTAERAAHRRPEAVYNFLESCSIDVIVGIRVK